MRLHYVDGLKALGAFIVFFCHFNGLFSAFQVPKALSFINNGEFAVVLFMMLSGFSIALSLDKNGSWEKLQRTVLNRYFRFAIPLAVVITFAYILYLLGGYRNSEVANSMGRSFGSQDYMSISFFQYIASLLFSPMGYCSLNAPLWMLRYIFEGTFLVVALHIGVHTLDIKRKVAVLAVASLLSAVENIYLADVVIGMLLFELWRKLSAGEDRIFVIKNVLSVALLLFSIYIADSFARVNGTVEKLSEIMLSLAAFALCLSVLLSNLFQRLFSVALFRFLGSVSFEIYMFHWIVICSFSSFLFIQWNVLIPIGLNFLLTTILILLMSMGMKQWIEPKMLRPVDAFLLKWLLK